MNENILKMIIAGISFGVWPLLMNKSNLNSTTSTVIFAIIIAILVTPVGFYQGFSISGSKWWFALFAGFVGAVGLLVFNSGLSKVIPEAAGRLFVIMIVVQTAVPSLYSMILGGELKIKTIIGFIFAIISAILLV